MGIAFKQFFMAVTVLFAALERICSAVNHLAVWADETSGAFEDEARIDRVARRKQLELDAGVITAPVALVAPAAKKA